VGKGAVSTVPLPPAARGAGWSTPYGCAVAGQQRDGEDMWGVRLKDCAREAPWLKPPGSSGKSSSQ